jgi:membrane-bound lytic murein transglycosylase B
MRTLSDPLRSSPVRLLAAMLLALPCAVPLSASAQPSGQGTAAANPTPVAKPEASAPVRAAPTPAPADTARPAPARKPVPPAPDWPARADVREFVGQMVERHGFDATALLKVFARTRGAPTAIRFMTPPPPGARRSWTEYRDRFVEPFRIREGLRFWREQSDAVARAAERWGVPPEIIVSIIGIETLYGRNTGEFRVMDALTTLAFDYPRRAAYFREELEQFLLLTRESGVDPFEWRGSFAGAVGLPQFMPGSIRRHAVDFDGDGRIDLRGSPVDAIGSVARFLADHGWVPGGTTHYAVTIADEVRARPAVEAGIPPAMTTLGLAALGVTSPQQIDAAEKLSLIDLPDGDAPTRYVLGAHNFWVITRYNRSYFYAMAVIDLAGALKAAPGAPSTVSTRY